MSQTENESLIALEHLLEEFFGHATSNQRKHEIETQLHSFSNQRDCWKFCVHFLTHTSSQFVSMYAVSTIESVINRQWVSLEWENRVQLKNALYKHLIEQNITTPHFLRNKLVKLLIDIARYDWPHFYPEFFTNILQLLQSEQGQLLGLIFLRTTSEEFMSPRPDLSSQRREELSRLLQQHIPQIFQILTTILDSLGTRPRHSVTATPPPSPTHPSSLPDLACELSTASFRPDNRDITKEALSTTQQLFTWAQLTQVPLQLIKAIFHFTNVSTYAQDDDDMCVLAMSTLNELLYRKCAPPGSQDVFIQLYHCTVQLLNDIMCPSAGRIETLGNDFVDKLSELLALLVEQHLWRLEAEPGFSALGFLSLLFQLTIQLPSIHCYMRCLAVWAAFIKQLKPQNAQKYSQALLGLVTTVLNKIQFNCNQTQLEETDNDHFDDDNETEWQVFLKTSIEIIAMVAEYAPIETFNQVLIPWKSANDIYCMLQNTVDHRNRILNIEPSENERLHCILRDLSSLIQTLARLSTFFLDEDCDYYKTSAPIVGSLISKMIESASVATNTRFYLLKISDQRLTDDLIEVHSQILAGLKTWLSWLSLNREINNEDVKQLLTVSLPILRAATQNPAKVSHSSAHLFLSISGTVFPPSLIVQPSVVEFVHVAPTLKYNGNQTREVVNNAICNILIRPWGELSQSDAINRNMLINIFFETLTKEFRELTVETNEAKIREVVAGTLPCLSHIVEFSKSYPSPSKKLLYLGIKVTVDHALELFPVYAKYRETNDHILQFFLNVLCVLQQQIGIEGITRAVEVFLDVAVNQQQAKDFSGLDKLLRILELVVESPGPSYKSFLPGILQLCLQHVYPLVICQANDQPDVVIALITLLHSILLHRWQFFYTSQVRLGYSPACNDIENVSDNLQHPEQMLAVLQVFGQALLQPDINIFRTSLITLEDLNGKWKLYHKVMFREHLLNQFLTVLLHTLLDKTHALLTDDILLTVYNLAAVDFQRFFNTFLSEYLQTTEGVAQSQLESLKQSFNHETDMPTFIHHMQRFVNDLRCYRLCNASLPLGSVIL